MMNLVEKRVRSTPFITFSNDDYKAPDPDQDDLMVISIQLAEYAISKILVNQGRQEEEGVVLTTFTASPDRLADSSCSTSSTAALKKFFFRLWDAIISERQQKI